MRSFFQFQSMFSAFVVIATISAAWLLASVSPASASPALRGTSMAEPELAASSQSGAPQPVAQSAPPHFTVICEAGCSSENAGVVGLTPRKPRLVAKNPVGAMPADEAVCIGGCYEDAGPAVAGAVDAAPVATNWTATATGSGKPVRGPDQPAASTSGRWYDRIGNSGAR